MPAINEIIALTIECGQIILENGGETHRVEQVMKKVARHFGMRDCESYVTLTGIMLTVTDLCGNDQTVIRRIKNRSVNLQKITAVEKLLEEIKSYKLTPPEFAARLQQIRALKSYSRRTMLFYSGLLTASFAMLFAGSWPEFIIAFLAGVILKALLLMLSSVKLNDFFTNMTGGALAALLALIASAFWPGVRHEPVIIGAIMLLLPGLAITNAIRDTMAGDLVSGIVRGIEAFLTAVGIAAGTALTFLLWQQGGI